MMLNPTKNEIKLKTIFWFIPIVLIKGSKSENAECW